MSNVGKQCGMLKTKSSCVNSSRAWSTYVKQPLMCVADLVMLSFKAASQHSVKT